AIEDRPLPASELRIAPLEPVAVHAVLASRIVEDELAAAQLVVAGIHRAIHTVVTLAVVEARLPEDGSVGRAAVGRAPVGAGVSPVASIPGERARASAARTPAGREEKQKPER